MRTPSADGLVSLAGTLLGFVLLLFGAALTAVAGFKLVFVMEWSLGSPPAAVWRAATGLAVLAAGYLVLSSVGRRDGRESTDSTALSDTANVHFWDS
ncbi:hypothetical protein [Halosimplex salinum]|uniref:hypothetical protein n=1 Tax=Halosimplex salinum TaxID=1710538 RepID=UPI000F48085B|nr:hypothetical protein [Halosimplex salinum]